MSDVHQNFAKGFCKVCLGNTTARKNYNNQVKNWNSKTRSSSV